MLRLSKSLPPAVHKLASQLEDVGFFLSLVHTKGAPRPLHGNMGPLIHGETFFGIKRSENPDSLIAYGLAHCSVNDNFSKAKGTHVAMNAAINNLSKVIGRSKTIDIFTRTQEELKP